MATRIQVRRDTAANWTTSGTTVLAAGEIGFETDTLLFKIGDGSQQWQNLEYAGGTEPIRNNPSGTSVTDLDAAALRNNGNSKYLISGADIVANEPSGLSTATDGQLLVTVAKFDYTGTSAANERYLMTLQTLTTGRFFYRTYNGSWSSWYEAVKADPSTGNVTIAGDLAVNGGDITTTSTGTATVFNTHATTLCLGEAAPSVFIGATTGTATIRNATTAISGNATVGGSATVGTTLGVTGNTTLTGDLAVNGGDITTTSATGNVFETTATTVTLGRAATTVCIADNATAAQTIDIGTGATVSGSTKTINIGTGGAAGSTTNINLGDADGGSVVVNRALTVNGLTTLSGGLSGTIDYSNLKSGTVINVVATVHQNNGASGSVGVGNTVSRTRTWTYTPLMSNSKIVIFSGFFLSQGTCSVASCGYSGSITGAVSPNTGTLTFTGPTTTTYSGAGSGTGSVSGEFVFVHTSSGSASRTYTVTAAVTGASGVSGGPAYILQVPQYVSQLFEIIP